MSSRGEVSLADIKAMLDNCLQGYVFKEKEHRLWVVYKGKIFRGLPLGRHGRGRSTGRVAIETGHVKHLANFFEIKECAKGQIESLNH